MKYTILLAVLLMAACWSNPKKNPLKIADYEFVQDTPDHEPGEGAGERVCDLRPGQELDLGQTYTDECEFMAYNTQGDFIEICVRKGDAYVTLVSCLDGEPELHRGDKVRLTWKMDNLMVDPEHSRSIITEMALELDDVRPGPLSRYLADEHPHHDYWGPDEWPEDYQKQCMDAVDYFIATTTIPVIRDVVDENREAVLPVRLLEVEGDEEDFRPSFVAILREGPGEGAQILITLGVVLSGTGRIDYHIWHEGKEEYVPLP